MNFKSLLRALYLSPQYKILFIKCDFILKSSCLTPSSVTYIYGASHKYFGGKITSYWFLNFYQEFHTGSSQHLSSTQKQLRSFLHRYLVQAYLNVFYPILMVLNIVFSVRQHAIICIDFLKTPKLLKNTLPICCTEEDHKETRSRTSLAISLEALACLISMASARMSQPFCLASFQSFWQSFY